MAKITGAFSKSVNSHARRGNTASINETMQSATTDAKGAQAETAEAEAPRSAVVFGHTLKTPKTPSDLSPTGARLNSSSERKNKVKLDFKAVQVGLDTESSHVSLHKDCGGFRLSFQDSTRSKSSVVRDIEKFTKFTEEDIRKSIKDSLKNAANEPPVLKVPHRLNIFFQEEGSVRDSSTIGTARMQNGATLHSGNGNGHGVVHAGPVLQGLRAGPGLKGKAAGTVNGTSRRNVHSKTAKAVAKAPAQPP